MYLRVEDVGSCSQNSVSRVGAICVHGECSDGAIVARIHHEVLIVEQLHVALGHSVVPYRHRGRAAAVRYKSEDLARAGQRKVGLSDDRVHAAMRT